MEPFYYSQMNKTERSVYHGMKTGLMALAPSFCVSRLEGRQLADIFSSCGWTVRRFSMR